MSVLLRHRHDKERTRNARLKRELALEHEHVRTSGGATPAGDERRLRGIPVIGRGVTGAIADTAP